MRARTHLGRLGLLACLGLATAAAAPIGPIRFSDQTEAAGIRFRHIAGGPEKHYIVESHGSGAGFLDADGDGDLDIYAVNGSTFRAMGTEDGPDNALLRNDGGRFVDVTEAAGASDRGWGAGLTVGDADGDGDDDIYVTNFGPNTLLVNRGEGRFRRGTVDGTEGDDYSAGAAFFDADLDGDLDLYVTNYVHFDIPADLGTEPPERLCVFLGGVRVYCGPKGLRGAADVFLLNDGAGAFVDATVPSGVVAANRYYGLGVQPFDLEGDGDLDIYVANDETPNVLFRNDGAARFEDIALMGGVAYNNDGDEEAGMGVDAGDIDNDGDDDLYVTNFFRETNTLYRNEGEGLFSDITSPSGLAAPTLHLLGWGTSLIDFDADGDLDLFVANGHVYPQVEQVSSGSSYRQPNQVFRNLGDGHYADVSVEAGLAGLEAYAVSRGAAFGDYDGDGDVDIFVNNLDSTATLLRNDTRGGRFLAVELEGPPGNPRGLGARLFVEHGGTTQQRTVDGAGSYLSHSGVRAHFGLGSDVAAARVTVRWPDGTRQEAVDVLAGHRLIFAHGGGHRLVAYAAAAAGD